MEKLTKGILLLALFIFMGLLTMTRTDWDTTQEVTDEGYEKYLMSEADINVNEASIIALAEQLRARSASPEDAIRRTASFVATNIVYDSTESSQYCYTETATSVLDVRRGDCVSMSRLTTALLRAQGIPARTAGGCLTKTRCGTLFATIPFQTAKVREMEVGDFKKRGFLHEWVEVWTPEKGWFIIEATTGQVFELNCGTYLRYSYDTNPIDRCVIFDKDFWDTCYIA